MSISKTNNIKSLKGLIMIALMFGIGCIPAPEPLTQMGMRLLGVFIGVLFGWIFIEVGSTSLIAIAALCIWNIDSPTNVLLNSFGSHVSLMMLAMLLVAAYMSQLGLGNAIINWLMHRKIVVGKPYIFFSFLLFGAYLISFASNSLAAAVIMVSIWRSVNAISCFKANSRQHCAFFIGTLIASLMGELSLPVKGAVVVYTSVYTSYTGNVMNMFQYMLAMIPATLSIIVVYILFSKYILRIDYSKLTVATDIISKEKLQPLESKQKIGGIVIIVFMISLLIPSIPLPFSFWTTLQSLNSGGLSILLMGIFYFLEVNGTPMFDIKALGGCFGWDVWFMTCAINYITGQVSNPDTGIQAIVTELIYPLVDGVNSLTLIILLIFLTIVLTNFMNNMVAATLMISVAALMSGAFGLNMGALVLIIAICAMNAYTTPAASPNAAIFFSQTDLVNFKGMFFHGVLTVLFFTIYIVVVIFPWMNFVM